MVAMEGSIVEADCEAKQCEAGGGEVLETHMRCIRERLEALEGMPRQLSALFDGLEQVNRRLVLMQGLQSFGGNGRTSRNPPVSRRVSTSKLPVPTASISTVPLIGQTMRRSRSLSRAEAGGVVRANSWSVSELNKEAQASRRLLGSFCSTDSELPMSALAQSNSPAQAMMTHTNSEQTLKRPVGTPGRRLGDLLVTAPPPLQDEAPLPPEDVWASPRGSRRPSVAAFDSAILPGEAPGSPGSRRASSVVLSPATPLPDGISGTRSRSPSSFNQVAVPTETGEPSRRGSTDTANQFSNSSAASVSSLSPSDVQRGFSSYASFASPVPRERPTLARRMSLVSHFSGTSYHQHPRMSTKLFRTSRQLRERGFLCRVVFLPNSPARLAWDMLNIALIAFLAIATPLSFVYLEGRGLEADGLNALLHLIDALWLVDVAVNFRTALMDGAFPVLDPWLIARHYLRTWLLLDVVSAVPAVVAPADSEAYWAIRVLKLLRLLKLNGLFSQVTKVYSHKSLLLVKGLLLVTIVSHLLACSWRLALRADSLPRPSGAEWWELYIEDLYWVMTTMTTVGYGDITPSGPPSRLYCIFAMAISSLFFGAIVAGLTNLSKGLLENEIEIKINQARDFMNRNRVPEELQRRVQYNLRVRLQQEHWSAMDAELLTALSPAVQRELSLSLLSDTVLHFPLFKDARYSFVAELAQAHTWVQCHHGDCVAERGQAVQEVVFVIRGELMARFGSHREACRRLDVAICDLDDAGELQENLGRDTKFSLDSAEAPMCDRNSLDSHDPEALHLCAGAWFGEACLFDLEHIRAATVFSVSEAALAVLTAHDYHGILKRYPRLQERHKELEAKIREGELDMTDLAFTEDIGAQRARAGWAFFNLFKGRSGTMHEGLHRGSFDNLRRFSRRVS